MSKILVTDDDVEVRHLMRDTLEHMGHSCAEAGDGDEAIAAYRNEPFDLVITDIIMPGRDGLETIQELRRDNPAAKILAISTGGRHGTGAYLKVATHLGAAGILSKPFSRAQFISKVKEVLTTSDPGV
jgi:CheY-like chemotaxis protein